jgi:hypothetical protein
LIRLPETRCGSSSLEFEHFGFGHAGIYNMLAQAFVAVPAGWKEIVPTVGKPPVTRMPSEGGNAAFGSIVLDLTSANRSDLALAVGAISSGQST